MGISGSVSCAPQKNMAHPPQAQEKTSRNTLGRLKSQLERIDESKEALKTTIESLEKLKYKPGDFVVHKKYGNCMITDYFIKNTPDLDMGMIHHDNSNTNTDYGYTISSPNWDIYHPVSEEDLIEYNNTTKLLYNK